MTPGGRHPPAKACCCLAFRSWCRLCRSTSPAAFPRRWCAPSRARDFACVETATFPFMDDTQIPNDGGKASSRGTSSLSPGRCVLDVPGVNAQTRQSDRWILCRTCGWTFASARHSRRKSCRTKFIGGTFELTRIICHIQRRTAQQIEKYSTT